MLVFPQTAGYRPRDLKPGTRYPGLGVPVSVGLHALVLAGLLRVPAPIQPGYPPEAVTVEVVETVAIVSTDVAPSAPEAIVPAAVAESPPGPVLAPPDPLTSPAPSALSPSSGPLPAQRPVQAAKLAPLAKPKPAAKPLRDSGQKSTAPPTPTPTPTPPAPVAGKPAAASLPSAPAPAPVPSPAISTMGDYGATVWRKIARHKPAGLRFRGSVGVTFTISVDGNLVSATVSRRSGSEALDQVSLDAVRAATPFDRPPDGMTAGQLIFSISFDYR